MFLGIVYYDPKHHVGFGSVSKLLKSNKNKKPDVKEVMSGQNTNSLHKSVRKRFPGISYSVTNIDDVWEMDLADLS